MVYMTDVDIDNMNRWSKIKNQDIKVYSKDENGFVAELL